MLLITLNSQLSEWKNKFLFLSFFFHISHWKDSLVFWFLWRSEHPRVVMQCFQQSGSPGKVRGRTLGRNFWAKKEALEWNENITKNALIWCGKEKDRPTLCKAMNKACLLGLLLCFASSLAPWKQWFLFIYLRELMFLYPPTRKIPSWKGKEFYSL